MGKREQAIEQTGRSGRFVSFRALESRSLEAYVAYVRAVGTAVVGEGLKRDMSEAYWDASWRRYWAYRDAPIRGSVEGVLQ